MANLRVQVHIARSGRYHLFQPAYNNIRSALIAMRSKARIAQMAYRTYYINSYQENAHLKTDNKTYIDVVSNGGAKRRFSIVLKRGGEPVPFDHLLKKAEAP